MEDDYFSRRTNFEMLLALLVRRIPLSLAERITVAISSWTSDCSRMLECSSGLGSAQLSSAYRSHAANSRETKRNHTFNIAFTCGTTAGPARRRSPNTYAYAAFRAAVHTCTCPRVSTRRPVPLSRAPRSGIDHDARRTHVVAHV